MAPIELAAGEAWAAGENGERFDENNLSKTIEAADPATVPYIIMIRPRGASCPAAGACGSIYPAYVSASTAATWYEARGSLRLSTEVARFVCTAPRDC